MKKRIVALAAGTAILVGSAAVPLSSAHGFSRSLCQTLQSQASSLGDQLDVLFDGPQTPSVQAQERALEARLSQIFAVGDRLHCFG